MNDLPLTPINTFSDHRGRLSVICESMDIPFEIRRIYYIYKTNKNHERGFHAHKETRQFAVCLNGYCKIKMDNGNDSKIYELKEPNQGLLIDLMIWHHMFDFSDDCILLVLASKHYEENDYIHDYEEFKSNCKN